MAAVSALCSHAILIHNGRLEYSDRAPAVIDEYLRRVRKDAETGLSDRGDRQGNGRVRLTRVELFGSQGEPIQTASSGQDVAFQINYDLVDGKPLRNAVVQLKFAGSFGQPLFACASSAASEIHLC